MPGLFICYRRGDSAGHAGRLFDSMHEAFGSRVFMDQTAIEAGQDFAEVIKRAVSSSDVMLAVIGSEWLTATDESDKRRLDDPEDFIALELGTALAGNVRVIPVLVDGARMPRAADLPEVLKSLTRRQAVELRDSRWSADVRELVELLGKTPLGAEAQGGAQRPGARRRASWPIWAGAGLAVIVAAVLGFRFLSFERPEVIGPSPLLPASPTVPAPSPIVPQPSPSPPEPSPSVREPSPIAPEPSPIAPEPSPTHPRSPLVVPSMVGTSLAEARVLLSVAGLRIGKIAQVADGSAAPDTVLGTRPPEGTAVPAGTAIDLRIAVPERPTRHPTNEPERIKVRQVVRVRQTFMVDADDGRVASGRDADVWFEAVTDTERYLSAVNRASLASASAGARLADCMNAKYGVPRIPLGRVKAGAEFCVRTNGGRYGVIKVPRALTPDSTTLVLDILTWESQANR